MPLRPLRAGTTEYGPIPVLLSKPDASTVASAYSDIRISGDSTFEVLMEGGNAGDQPTPNVAVTACP